MTWHRTRTHSAPERKPSPPFRELHPVAQVMIVLLCVAMIAACSGLVIAAVRFAVLAWYWGADSAEWFLST